MTDIHSCSYYCDRPECIRRQRDELREKISAAELEITRLESLYRQSLDEITAMAEREMSAKAELDRMYWRSRAAITLLRTAGNSGKGLLPEQCLELVRVLGGGDG